MRVLVVGGAGYIGSVVTRVLQEQNIEPVVFDDLSHGHRQAVPANCPFIEGDMGSFEQVCAALANSVEAVMHFGGFIQVGESVHDPAGYYQNNFVKSLTLFNAMRASGIKKLIVSSTAAVYGEPDKFPITEDFPLQPTSPYGETKLAVERLLGWYASAYGLNFVALRYFNAAGAFKDAGEDHHPESHLIPLVLQVADGTRESITINGADYNTPDGTCIRDYIHVQDLAEAHVSALQYLSDGGTSQAFNLGSGSGASVRQVITAAQKATGKHIATVSGARRQGDPAVLVASNERIRKVLGWEPRYSSMETILADAWRWKREHPQGYRQATEVKTGTECCC